MLNRLTESYHRWRLHRTLRDLQQLPPLPRGTVNCIALSMVQPADVWPYLLALRSFAQHCPPARVVVVCDPKMDESHRAFIRGQVPHIEFLNAQDYWMDGLPRGGTWERLTAIADLCSSSFVIQLDADTVTVDSTPEVVEAVQNQTSFALATTDVFPNVMPTVDISEWAGPLLKTNSNSHVQLHCEAALAGISRPPARYVRGCSGFSGFARGSFSVDVLADFSKRMQAAVGNQWNKWGTEQFASNVMVANAPNAIALPFPKYCSPGQGPGPHAFLHFIGFVRHIDGLYTRTARQFIENHQND